MGRLLSINLGDDMERKLSYYTPGQIRHQTLMRLRGVFTAISRRKPILLILEDMHWSDDLSMDLVSLKQRSSWRDRSLNTVKKKQFFMPSAESFLIA